MHQFLSFTDLFYADATINASCMDVSYFPSLNFVLFCLLADMRRDVQEIFRMTPHEKHVMMFSATLSKEIRPVCKKFMQDVII